MVRPTPGELRGQPVWGAVLLHSPVPSERPAAHSEAQVPLLLSGTGYIPGCASVAIDVAPLAITVIKLSHCHPAVLSPGLAQCLPMVNNQRTHEAFVYRVAEVNYRILVTRLSNLHTILRGQHDRKLSH